MNGDNYKARLKAARRELESLILEVEWDYASGLTPRQIQQILDGDRFDVEEELWSMNDDYIFDIRDAARQRIAENNDVDPDDLLDTYPVESVNLEGLAANTRGYIALETDIEHDPYWHNGSRIARERLSPFMNEDEITYILANTMYNASLNFLFSTRVLDGFVKGLEPLAIEKGTYVVFHTSGVGATSTPAKINKPVEIKEGWKFYADRLSRYGVQAVCGLNYHYWDSGGLVWKERNDENEEDIHR